MNKKNTHQKAFKINREETLHRASRLEGKVKNRGIKNVRKKRERSK